MHPTAIRVRGQGPVAMALRLFLGRQGFGAGEVAAEPPAPQLPPWLAQRAIALSAGSWQLLARVIELPEAAPIAAVDVSMRGDAGRTRITAAELGVPALGRVLRYEALHRALADGIARADAAGPRAAASHAGSAALLQPDFAPAADAAAVEVTADGEAGTRARERDFGQSAVLAEIDASRPSAGIAYERFTAEGPLALLPLPGAGRNALVWCASPEASERRAALPPAEFERELQEAFGPALGELRLAGERHVSPLVRRWRGQRIGPRAVAIGNAAQALHPVAGQGLNLGLRDAFVLAQCLGDARDAGAPPQAALDRFESARRLDRGATVRVTDALAAGFTHELLRPLQSIGLALLDSVPALRRGFASGFMFGLRRL